MDITHYLPSKVYVRAVAGAFALIGLTALGLAKAQVVKDVSLRVFREITEKGPDFVARGGVLISNAFKNNPKVLMAIGVLGVVTLILANGYRTRGSKIKELESKLTDAERVKGALRTTISGKDYHISTLEVEVKTLTKELERMKQERGEAVVQAIQGAISGYQENAGRFIASPPGRPQLPPRGDAAAAAPPAAEPATPMTGRPSRGINFAKELNLRSIKFRRMPEGFRPEDFLNKKGMLYATIEQIVVAIERIGVLINEKGEEKEAIQPTRKGHALTGNQDAKVRGIDDELARLTEVLNYLKERVKSLTINNLSNELTYALLTRYRHLNPGSPPRNGGSSGDFS